MGSRRRPSRARLGVLTGATLPSRLVSLFLKRRSRSSLYRLRLIVFWIARAGLDRSSRYVLSSRRGGLQALWCDGVVFLVRRMSLALLSWLALYTIHVESAFHVLALSCELVCIRWCVLSS